MKKILLFTLIGLILNVHNTQAQKKSGSNANLAENAKRLFNEKKYLEAAELYELIVKNPEPALLDYYYLGMSYYFQYGYQKSTNLNPPKDLLVKADTAFSFLAQRSPTTQAGWQYRARINRLMDDENDSQGLAVPFYETYVKLVTVDKPELAAKSTAGLIEAYNYLGIKAVGKERNTAKAKEYFDKVKKIDPSNATAILALKAMGY